MDREVPVGYFGLLAGYEVSVAPADITTYFRLLALRAASGSSTWLAGWLASKESCGQPKPVEVAVVA